MKPGLELADVDVAALETRLQHLKGQIVERRRVIADLRAGIDRVGYVAGRGVALKSFARGLAWGGLIGLGACAVLLLALTIVVTVVVR
jgi:hypothetical protein